MIPATVWAVFAAGWLEATKAPADAPSLREQGYLYLQVQGKLTGYVIAPLGYGLIVGYPR